MGFNSGFKGLNFCIFLYFWIANCKTIEPAANDNKHSLISSCSEFLPARNFDLSGALPIFGLFHHFKRFVFMLHFCPACFSCLTKHKIRVHHEFLMLFRETRHIDNITKPLSRNTKKIQLCNTIYYSEVY